MWFVVGPLDYVDGLDALTRELDDLAWEALAHVTRPDTEKTAGLRGYDPTLGLNVVVVGVVSQVADRYDFADAQRSVAVGIADAVDAILLHDNQGVGQWCQLHQVLYTRGPVRTVKLALGWVQTQGLGYQLRVGVRRQTDAATEYHFTK